MLVGFSVQNFRSFKEKQAFSMVASKITRHGDHIVANSGRRLLKSSIILGANAAGKSNLIKAVEFSKNIILKDIDEVNLEKMYFRIVSNGASDPGIFEYDFITRGVEYNYGIAISYKDKEIISEWLYKKEKKDEEKCIFSRNGEEKNTKTDSEYDYPEDKFLRVLDDFRGELPAPMRKRTILSDAANRYNVDDGLMKDIKNVYRWFLNLIVIFPNSKYNRLGADISDNEYQTFLQDKISAFDTGIERMKSISKELDIETLLSKMEEKEVNNLQIQISNRIDVDPITIKQGSNLYLIKKDKNGNLSYDIIGFDHGNPDDLFEFGDESDGTIRLFDLIPIFIIAKKNEGAVFFVDEIDRSLHSKLTKRFFDMVFGYKGEYDLQLISTTHDSDLLDLNQFRQDEIWFVDRKADHSTELYSLNRYGERFDKRIDKEYLQGKYGAIPEFDEELLTVED